MDKDLVLDLIVISSQIGTQPANAELDRTAARERLGQFIEGAGQHCAIGGVREDFAPSVVDPKLIVIEVVHKVATGRVRAGIPAVVLVVARHGAVVVEWAGATRAGRVYSVEIRARDRLLAILVG